MKSLHDLIYGNDDTEQQQQDEEKQQQKPPPRDDTTKVSRKRTDISSSNNKTTEQPNDTTAVPSILQRMSVLYNPSTAITNAEDPLQASLNPPVAKKATRRETTMTEERRAKLERKSEWRQIRRQWKRRQVNYREETDVGDVLQQVFLHNSATPDETEPILPLPEHPTDLLDTSDEEEEAILRQLTQNSRQEEKRKKRKLQEEQEELKRNDIFIPYQDKMNFHDRGFVQPDDLDPLRQYEQQKQAVVQQFVKNNHPYPKHSGEAITLRPIRVAHRLKPQESTFPPLDHNLYCSPQFVHKRQVLRLAARFLLASGRHRDSHTMSRFLHCLWNSDMLEASNASLIRSLAKETASRYHLFWSHLWKNRNEVAELLGITKELQVAGPHVGYRLDVKGFDNKRNEIMKVKKTQSHGSISPGGPQKKKSGLRKTVAMKGDFDLRAVVSYAFTPGTIPPVPRHPLDESGVVLGPPDKFSNYITGRVVIEESTLTLTSAHLLAIFAANIKSNTSTEDICSQIQRMFRKAIDLNKKIAKFATLATAEDDWPLPHVYRSWMGYFSLVTNGLLGFTEDSPSAHKSETTIKYGQTTIAPYLDDISTSFSSVKEVAAEFYEIYQQADQTIGLERFGDYHVVNGLFRIAKDLPESVARLLLQPLNKKSDRMPFKRMHSILVHLERNGMLTEKSSTANSVSVIELEYAMYQSSQIFFKCIERDPTELKFHCWHLATLGCSLLLCAGNRIDSGAFLEPSSGQEMSRQPLPKFQETRRDTARALYLLFQLASKQRNQTHVALSSDVHLAVSWFLEWQEVVALLIGSPCWKEKTQAVNSIHRHHTNLWAYSCLDTCQGLSRQAEDHSVRIEAAARSLEQDPSCKLNWRVLAFELGAVGCRPTAVDLKTNRFCVKKECPQCSLLIPDRYIDHIQGTRDEESKHWWGRDRKGWWHSCVLGLRIPTRYDFGSLNTALQKCRLPFYRSFRSSLTSNSVNQPVPLEIDEGPDTSNLDKLYELLTDVDAEHLEQDPVINGPVGDYLPKPFRETLSQINGHSHEESLLTEFANAIDDDVLEVECYRIIIASHLHGPRHPWVLSTVVHLATSAWDRKSLSIKQDSAEWTAVKWLYQMGINSTNVVKLSSKLHGKKPRMKNY